MDKYIKAVLAADGKVIIPRFGCIIEPSEEPGTLSFNPYLNFEDGKLAAAVCAGEDIDSDSAARKIADAVDSYNNTLSDGGTVSIAGIGSFSKDADGRVEFTQADDFVHGDGDISLGMGIKTVADDTYTPATEPATEQTPEPEPEPQPSANADADNEPAQPAVSYRIEDEQKKETEASTGEEKKRRWPLVLLVIVLLIIIIWLLLFVFFKDNAVYSYYQSIMAPAPVEQVAPPAPADTTALQKDTVEAQPAPEAKKAKPRKEPTEARTLEHRYNVIVGSYKEEATAIKRVADLQAKGYTDAFVGIKKEYFVAVIKDFSNLTQAEAFQEKIVDGPDHIESWITNSGEND